MTVVMHEAAPETEARQLQQIAALLGGARTLKYPLRSRLDAHEMLLNGLPGRALSHLVDHLSILPLTSSLEQAVGMSQRTY